MLPSLTVPRPCGDSRRPGRSKNTVKNRSKSTTLVSGRSLLSRVKSAWRKKNVALSDPALIRLSLNRAKHLALTDARGRRLHDRQTPDEVAAR